MSLLTLLPSLASATTKTTQIQGFDDSGLSSGASKILDCDFTPNTGSEIWHIKSDAAVYAKSNDNGRAHVGSGSSKFNGTVSLSKTAIPADAVITNIQLKVYLAKNSKVYTATPMVNGTNFSDSQQLTGSSGGANVMTFDFTGNTVGNDIVLNFESSTNGYINFTEISVTYEGGSTNEPTKFDVPEISCDYDVAQFSITPATNTTESYQLWYCVTDTETLPDAPIWLQYSAPVDFAEDYNIHYVHAYAQSLDIEKYYDSDIATALYKVKDPSIKEVTATVKFIDGEQSWQNYNSDPHENTWVSTDKLFSFKTVASLEPGHSGNNYPLISTSSPKGLRIYNTSSNLITVYAPDGYTFKSVSYTSSNDKNHVSFDGTEKNNNDPYEFPSPASDFGLRSVKSNENNNTAVQTITVVLEPKPEKKVYAHPFGESIDPVMEGDTYQFNLGAEHPSITYTWEGDAHCSIDDNGLLRGESVGTDWITASWGDDVWEEGSARFSVTIFEKPIEKQPLASPTFSLDEAEKTVTIYKEGEGTVYFVVNNNETATAEECVNMYDAPISFETEPGIYYVHAYVRAEETSQYFSDSPVTEISYEVTAIQKKQHEVPAINVQDEVYVITRTVDEGGVIVYAHTVRGEEPTVWNEYSAPVAKATEPGEYTIHAYIKASQDGEYTDSETVTAEYTVENHEVDIIDSENIDEALDLGAIDDVVEEGDLEVSTSNFVIKSGLHVYAVDGTSVYVTDNVNGGKGTRIDDVPADMVTDKVLVNVMVKYVHNKVTGVKSFRYVNHEEDSNSAAPEATELELTAFYGHEADYLHHHIKLNSVYYDGEAGTISLPAPAAEMMSRAPADHAYVINVDKDLLGSAYGYADVWGYVKHDGTQPVFTALRLGEIQTGINGVQADGGVNVVNGEIVAPEGSEVFTVNGMRVAVSGRQAPGIYVVRLSDGQAVKVVVK